MLSPRSVVLALSAYHPPLAHREGLRLDFNENTVGCSPRVLETLRSLTAEQLARYPERGPAEARLAQHLGISPEEVLLTNGVDEAIHLLCETYLEPEDEVLIPVPTFAMYELFAAATRATIRKIACMPGDEFPSPEFHRCLSERTRLIAIANPNNPTGAVVPRDVLLGLARSAPNAAFLIDEAYFEFYGETLVPQWRDTPNLFVARTFSKAYGLAGLRMGTLLGNCATIRDVCRVASPYSVNAAALACLPAALADHGYVERYATQVCSNRERLQQRLLDWGIPFWPSRANFLLISIGAQHTAFVLAMRDRGILVRDRSSDPGCDGCVRVTVGTDAQTDLLLDAMQAVLAELRLLPQESLR